ncbi:MAG: hypothetical protein ABIJ56_03870 [Pseudomonadota bacterium]
MEKEDACPAAGRTDRPCRTMIIAAALLVVLMPGGCSLLIDFEAPGRDAGVDPPDGGDGLDATEPEEEIDGGGPEAEDAQDSAGQEGDGPDGGDAQDPDGQEGDGPHDGDGEEIDGDGPHDPDAQDHEDTGPPDIPADEEDLDARDGDDAGEEPLCGNGEVDEGEECDPPGLDSRDCTTSCESTGTQTCVEGCAWGECGPPVESCNGLDDNCDGQPDEGFECVLGEDPRDCVNPAGVPGTSECSASCLWTPCCGIEDCDNGYDDNCDGVVDEPGRMGGQIRVTDDPGHSTLPSPAWTGSEIVMAWHDNRDGRREIYIARASGLGEKLGGDIRLTDSPGDSTQPWLRWTGSEMAVAWSDTRDGNAEIYFARATAAGEKIGDDARITDDPGVSVTPVMQWAETQLGVAWVDDRDGGADESEIYFALISSSGEKTGGDIRLTDATGVSDMPSLAWTGSQFGVAWKDWRDEDYEIYFALVSPEGVKEAGDVRVTSVPEGSGGPSIQWTGSRFALAWCDARDGFGVEIYYTTLSGAGAKEIDDVRVTNAPLRSGFPSLQWTGSEVGLSWSDARDDPSGEIYFTRLSLDGERLGSDVRVSSRSGLCEYPELVWTGSLFAAAWHSDCAGSLDIYLALIGCD